MAALVQFHLILVTGQRLSLNLWILPETPHSRFLNEACHNEELYKKYSTKVLKVVVLEGLERKLMTKCS